MRHTCITHAGRVRAGGPPLHARTRVCVCVCVCGALLSRTLGLDKAGAVRVAVQPDRHLGKFPLKNACNTCNNKHTNSGVSAIHTTAPAPAPAAKALHHFYLCVASCQRSACAHLLAIRHLLAHPINWFLVAAKVHCHRTRWVPAYGGSRGNILVCVCVCVCSTPTPPKKTCPCVPP